MTNPLPLTALLFLWAILIPVRSTTHAQSPAPPSVENTPTKLTIEGDIPPSIAPVVGRMTALFYECLPRLLKRFEDRKKPLPHTIRLRFDRSLKVPAMADRSSITVSIDWIEKHPEDIGLLTHELTHIIQAYPSPAPGWITEGIADYARHLYGPSSQPNWSLPSTLTPAQHYTNSYRVSARFLLWLESTHPGAVDKIHRRMQTGGFQEEEFAVIAGAPIDQLWQRCIVELQTAKPPLTILPQKESPFPQAPNPFARPAGIPRARIAETERKANAITSSGRP
jgi:hypothetical protein